MVVMVKSLVIKWFLIKCVKVFVNFNEFNIINFFKILVINRVLKV